jgi:hypothetical protein
MANHSVTPAGYRSKWKNVAVQVGLGRTTCSRGDPQYPMHRPSVERCISRK